MNVKNFKHSKVKNKDAFTFGILKWQNDGAANVASACILDDDRVSPTHTAMRHIQDKNKCCI